MHLREIANGFVKRLQASRSTLDRTPRVINVPRLHAARLRWVRLESAARRSLRRRRLLRQVFKMSWSPIRWWAPKRLNGSVPWQSGRAYRSVLIIRIMPWRFMRLQSLQVSGYRYSWRLMLAHTVAVSHRVHRHLPWRRPSRVWPACGLRASRLITGLLSTCEHMTSGSLRSQRRLG